MDYGILERAHSCHAVAHGGVRTPSESLYRKLTLGEKFLATPTGESNLLRRRAGPMLYLLGYIPSPLSLSPVDWAQSTN